MMDAVGEGADEERQDEKTRIREYENMRTREYEKTKSVWQRVMRGSKSNVLNVMRTLTVSDVQLETNLLT